MYQQMANIAEKIAVKRIAERTIELAEKWQWLLPIEIPSEWDRLHSGNVHNSHARLGNVQNSHARVGAIDLSLPRLPNSQRAWLEEHCGRWHFDILASTLCFEDEEDLTSYTMRWGE